jgi:hypothetical protein
MTKSVVKNCNTMSLKIVHFRIDVIWLPNLCRYMFYNSADIEDENFLFIAPKYRSNRWSFA